MRTYNFSAGPAVLPEPVLEATREALWDIAGSGIGVAEHSHRGGVFVQVAAEAEADCRRLAGISDDYAVLFLQGGASTQFAMVPANFLPEGGTADYLVTGSWSKKAVKEAKHYGGVHVAATSEASNFDVIPKAEEIAYSDAPAYVHFTSNNTIFGTQWVGEPSTPDGVWLACDASSDIFSRPVDVAKYGVLYAGAQKNLGPSGVTLVVIRRDLLEASVRELPSMFQYGIHASNDSMYNTPPTLGIYMIGQVFKWILDQGGLEGVAAKNEEKARLLYDVLETEGFYDCAAGENSRSLMNVTFRTPSKELDEKFVAESEAAGFSGLKGHRSVGGMRASIYNAFPKAGCEAFAAFLRDFAKQNG